jgi:DNA-directed RNA polymerase subunit RPC12/RpoP
MLGRNHYCQECGSRSVHLSRTGWFGAVARLLFLHPIRCRDCGNRFWRLTTAPPPRPSRRPPHAGPEPAPA